MDVAVSSFLRLPREIITGILARLPALHLLQCLLSCKTLKHQIDSSARLSYILKLAQTNMMDDLRCSYSSFPSKRRLDMLEDYVDRWRRLDLRLQQLDLSSVDPSSAVFGVFAQVFCLAQLHKDEDPDDLAAIHFFDISQPTDEAVKTEPFRKIILDDGVDDFAVAADDHDLLVCFRRKRVDDGSFELTLQFLQYSTLRPHPQAKLPQLRLYDITFVTSAEDMLPSLRHIDFAMGNLLTVIMEGGPDDVPCQIFIFDWTTGKEVATVKANASSVSFLSETTFVATNDVENTLDVYRLDLTSPDTKSQALEPLLILQLPPLQVGLAVDELNCHSNPPLHPCPLGVYSSPHGTTSLPFTADSNAPLIFLTMGLRVHSQASTRQFRFILHRRRFTKMVMDRLKANTQSACNHLECLTMPWSDWGPEIAFCEERGEIGLDQPLSNYHEAVLGSKFIVTKPTGDGKVQLCVYDFSPQVVADAKRAAAKGSSPSDSSLLPTSSVTAGSHFVNDVVCSLPCVKSKTVTLDIGDPVWYNVDGIDSALVFVSGSSEIDLLVENVHIFHI